MTIEQLNEMFPGPGSGPDIIELKTDEDLAKFMAGYVNG